MASPLDVASVPRGLPAKKLAPPSSAFADDAEHRPCLKGPAHVKAHVLHPENGVTFAVSREHFWITPITLCFRWQDDTESKKNPSRYLVWSRGMRTSQTFHWKGLERSRLVSRPMGKFSCALPVGRPALAQRPEVSVRVPKVHGFTAQCSVRQLWSLERHFFRSRHFIFFALHFLSELEQ